MKRPADDDIIRRHGDRQAGRVPLVVLEPLMDYLERNDLAHGEIDVVPLGEGHSNVTYTVTAADRRIVLRRPPRPPHQPGTHDVLREARLLRDLGTLGARVPLVLAICEDESLIGAPFYLTEYLDGHVFEAQTPSLLTDSRDRIADEMVQVLTDIHALDYHGTELGRRGRPSGYTERQIRRFAELLDQYRHRDIPALDRLTSWLGASIPASPPTTIVHGDYRLGNMMFADESPARLLAALDWEMATIGDPLADLGYMCVMWAEPGDPEGLLKLSRATTEPGYPGRAELAERYEERSGRSTRNVRWYMTLALWKFCIIMEGLSRRSHAGDSDDAFVAGFGEDVLELASYAERLAKTRG